MARTWRWWHVLLAGVGGALVLAILATGLVGVLLLRVVSDLGTPGPEEDDPEVVAARETAAAALAAETDRLSAAVLEPALGPGAEHVGRGEVRPPCSVGQHNWKIDDDYDLACDLHRVEVVAAPDRASFATHMRDLDRALRAEGWTPSPVRTMNDAVRDFGGGVVELPATSYTRQAAGSTRTLVIRWAGPGAAVEGVTLWSDVPAEGYAVVATEQVEYFRR